MPAPQPSVAAEPAPAPYRILTAATIDQLEQKVIEAMASGYCPIGGPFNASVFLPPHGGIGQGVVLIETPKKKFP